MIIQSLSPWIIASLCVCWKTLQIKCVLVWSDLLQSLYVTEHCRKLTDWKQKATSFKDIFYCEYIFIFIKILALPNLTSFLNATKSSYSPYCCCYFADSLWMPWISLMHYINLDAILSAGTAVFKGRISVLYKNTFDNDDHGTSQFYLYWVFTLLRLSFWILLLIQFH